MDKTILYGRSTTTIGEQLYGTDKSLTADERTKKAQGVYDAVLNAFPSLRNLMINAQKHATDFGYVETILGRRRHIPDMMLPEFEFVPLKGYVNPDVDPLDPSTLQDQAKIPKRITDKLLKEFKNYKYFGQVVKRTKELKEEKIRVINNRPIITEASRQCLNSMVQGSAADLTKMAILGIENSSEWQKLGGNIVTVVHDEIIAEVPMEVAEEGGEILSRLMCEAADFLPFDISCDVETTLRWYGNEYPCPYPVPKQYPTEDPEEIKWIQWALLEMEYELPVFKDENGDTPRGNEGKGMNGVISDEYDTAIFDYMHQYGIENESKFIDHLYNNVMFGIVK